jgi:hypothetical protein
MEPFRYHVFICDQRKPEGIPCCTAVTGQVTAERNRDWTEAFIAAMHYNAREGAPLVVKAIGAQGVERLLDVGGGSAAYSIAFAQAGDRLHAMVLDLPNVLPIAQRHISEAGLAGRIETRAGDLRRDRFGAGSGPGHLPHAGPGGEPGFAAAVFRGARAPGPSGGPGLYPGIRQDCAQAGPAFCPKHAYRYARRKHL